MCPDENELVAFAAGSLPPDHAERLSVHLHGCEECRLLLSSLQSSAPVEGLEGLPGPGARVGKYLVLSRLGAGAMGVVLLGFDPQLERRVALKLVAAQEGGAGLDEARTLARLSHPHVVQVHEVFTHGPWAVIAMEYVKGEHLRQWLATPRTRAQIHDALMQAAQGLAAAHHAGVVHRDFKPENVLVGSDGRVRVTDFGLSRVLAESSATDAPLVTSRAGTPAYMAPELFDGRQGSTARSDQFALCVTALEALTGTRPAPDSRLAPLGARAWLRGLEADPSLRYPDVDALVAALHSHARRPLRVVAAIATLLALLLGGGLLLRPQPLPPACAALRQELAGLADPQQRSKLDETLRGRGFSDAARGRLLEVLAKNVTEGDSLLTKTCVAVSTPDAAQLRMLRLACLGRVLDGNTGTVRDVLANEGPGSQGLGAYQLLKYQPQRRCGTDRLVLAQASLALAGGSPEFSAQVRTLEADFVAHDLSQLREKLEPLLEVGQDAGYFYERNNLLQIRAALRHDDGDLQGERADLDEGIAVAEANGFDSQLLLLSMARLSAAANGEEAKLWFDVATQRSQRLQEEDEGDRVQALGLAYWSLGDLGAAEVQLGRAAEVWRQLLTADDPMVGSTEVLQGQALIELGRFSEGTALLTRGRATLVRAMGADSLHLLEATRALLHGALWQERLDEARPLVSQACALRRASDGETPPALAECAVHERWLASLQDKATSPLPAEGLDDDLRLLVATIDAEAALSAGDVAGARTALESLSEGQTPLDALAEGMRAEAEARLGASEEAKRRAENVLARFAGRNHPFARAHALFALALLERGVERRTQLLDEARAASLPGTRLATRLAQAR